jgi:hypothetical protein
VSNEFTVPVSWGQLKKNVFYQVSIYGSLYVVKFVKYEGESVILRNSTLGTVRLHRSDCGTFFKRR